MVSAVYAIVICLCTLNLESVIDGLSIPSSLSSDNIQNKVLNAEVGGAVAGRIVFVPTKDYKQAFKATLKLGQCPLVMVEGRIKTCKDEFEGERVFIAKGAMTVDVSRVQSSEDVLLHIMGGVGGSIGVLGLASLSAKIKAAVTTDTSQNSLNLMSSYQISKGVVTLQSPRPKHVEGDRPLFLSEIEIGGNEILLVTLDFESEKQKFEVEMSVTFKVLFISITAKLNHINENFKAKASCRIQFKSSWREEQDIYFSSLAQCIPKVRTMEEIYTSGPQELRDMSMDDERSHYMYYFSSWKASPYGTQFNLALINHDLDFLNEQNTEIKAVIQRINKLKDQSWPSEVRRQIVQLNETLTDMSQKLATGLDEYHTLNAKERQQLRNIYGQHKAPQYYRRYLNKIIA